MNPVQGAPRVRSGKRRGNVDDSRKVPFGEPSLSAESGILPGGRLGEIVGPPPAILPAAVENSGSRAGEGRHEPTPSSGDQPARLALLLGKAEEFGGGPVVIDDAHPILAEGVQDGLVQLDEGPVLGEP